MGSSMMGSRWSALALIAVLAASGCQGARTRRAITAAEPGLVLPSDAGTEVVQAPAAPAAAPVETFADRHPLLSKPRQYYDSAGNNKVVKTAAGVVIGIPAGVVGELKQIVVGRPPAGTPR